MRHLTARPALDRLLRALLPGQCLACGEAASDALCGPCAQAHWPADGAVERCLQCGVRMLADGEHGANDANSQSDDVIQPRRCGRCVIARPAFDLTLALADYRPPLDIIVITLKFKRRPALAADLARRLADQLVAHADIVRRSIGHHAATEAVPELLIPAPASARRMAARGYNQAWEIARRIGRNVGIATNPSVLRRTHAAAQSGLDVAARRRNTRDTIDVAPGALARVAGVHIGVVDDVMTTGATFDAVARALKAAGARRVTNLVAFRTA
jgi:ComF family protein